MSKTIKTMIDPNDAVMLLIDHQSGLFQLVRDIDLPVLRSNVTALAKVGRSQWAADSGDSPKQPGRGLHPAHGPDQRLGQPGVGESD